MPFDVFLSYRRSDGVELAKTVYDFLTARGLRVFFDKEKMEDSQYFNTQIVSGITEAPHYILLATPDVFPFREGEDWVREEIKLAMTLYEAHPNERTLGVVLPAGTDFPYNDLPAEIEHLRFANQIILEGQAPSATELQRILRSVTKVTPWNLWNSGQRWLEGSKQAGRRFASLHIDQKIMPLAQAQKRADMPIRVTQKDGGPEQPLLDAIAAAEGHLYLIGQGGIGKTTALVHIMEQAYEGKRYAPNAQIPLFIELSRAPDSYGRLYENGRSSFIRRAVYQLLRADLRSKQVSSRMVEELDDAFNADPTVAVEPVTDLFTQEVPAPQFLLLLDGLNEASRTEIREPDGTPLLPVVTMLMEEIRELAKCPNVRLILTSRSDEEAMGEDIERLYLTGVDRETICAYLQSSCMTEQAINDALSDETLAETLKVPLFLTMYAALKDKGEVSTQGEIFRMFFSERGEQLDVYTAQGRLAVVDEDVAREGRRVQPKRLDRKMQWFLLDFLLPELAWHMVCTDRFYLDLEQIAELALPIFTDDSVTAVCGQYGKRLFTKYRDGSNLRAHTKQTADKLLALGEDPEESVISMVECCALSLGLLQERDGSFGFIHHHIRDYFASVKVQNSLRMAVYLAEHGVDSAFDCLALLNEAPIHAEVRRFLGEALGELWNAPYIAQGTWRLSVPAEPCNRNLLTRALDLYRGRFDGGVGYGVYNLVNILAQARGDLSGADLSRLDLRRCILNGVSLTRPGLCANLNGSLMGREVLFPMGHTGNVNSASYSPDGRHIVTASDDQTAKVWDAATGQCLLTLQGHSDWVNSAAYSPDGQNIVTISCDNTAKIWDAVTGQERSTFWEHCNDITSVAYSPNGGRIVTTSWDGTAKIWDAATGQDLLTLQGHCNYFTFVAYSPDEQRIVTDFGELFPHDNIAKVWNAATGQYLLALQGHSDRLNSAVYSPDGQQIVTASNDKTAKVWDAATGQCLLTLQGHSGEVNSAAYSPDGRRIVTASCDETAKIWDATTGQCLLTLREHSASVHSAVYSLDGRRIVTASCDETAKIWDAATGQCLLTFQGRSWTVNSAAYSPDGQRIATASWDKTAKVWDAATGQCLLTLQGHSEWVNFVAYSPDGRQIVTASKDNTVKVWDATTGQCLLTLQGHLGGVNSAAYSPDGKRIVTASGGIFEGDNTTAKIWDAATGQHLLTLQGHSYAVLSASYSPDGQKILTASWDETAKVWDADIGQCLLTLRGHSSLVKSAAYSPDGQQIVTASADKTAKIWDAATGQCLLTIRGHSDWINSAAYSPDGQQIVMASDDNTAKIWDAITGQCLLTLEHTHPVNSAAYSPDGQKIITAEDNIFRAWDARTGECLQTIPNIPGLFVQGLDLRRLRPDSHLSQEDRAALKTYGALVD